MFSYGAIQALGPEWQGMIRGSCPACERSDWLKPWQRSRGKCEVGLCCVEQNLYGSDAVSARDLIFLLTSEVYVQVRVVISRADL